MVKVIWRSTLMLYALSWTRFRGYSPLHRFTDQMRNAIENKRNRERESKCMTNRLQANATILHHIDILSADTTTHRKSVLCMVCWIILHKVNRLKEVRDKERERQRHETDVQLLYTRCIGIGLKPYYYVQVTCIQMHEITVKIAAATKQSKM